MVQHILALPGKRESGTLPELPVRRPLPEPFPSLQGTVSSRSALEAEGQSCPVCVHLHSCRLHRGGFSSLAVEPVAGPWHTPRNILALLNFISFVLCLK